MLNQETAKAARTDSGYILRAPRRMRVADAVAQYMRVPMGAGNSVPWDPLVAPYVIEPMNCLASREYDAVIFVGPARNADYSDDGGKSPRTLQKTTRQNEVA
ncbi:putative DNA packaging protein of putative prophage (terminase large subunit) [Shigella sonnei]|nr:putative DNA packaging protein of putative prophage (terminase large subunit) [Shigella sonnei]